MRIDLPQPYDTESILAFLSARSITGVEHFEGREYARIVPLDNGPAVVCLVLGAEHVDVDLEVAHPDDLGQAIEAIRRLLNLDADSSAIDAHLSRDRLLAPLIAATPGLRLPGSVDPFEATVRAIVGQQVSVAGARTVLGRIVNQFGDTVETATARTFGLTHAFPAPEALATAEEKDFSMPRSRARTIIEVARAIDSGDLVLDASDADLRDRLLAIRGIGPWTADYVLMRALGSPDVLLDTDLILARVLARDGVDAQRSAAWAPYRSYATLHLWRTA